MLYPGTDETPAVGRWVKYKDGHTDNAGHTTCAFPFLPSSRLVERRADYSIGGVIKYRQSFVHPCHYYLGRIFLPLL